MVNISLKRKNILNRFLIEIIPIILMIFFIPLIQNDFILIGIYIAVITFSLLYRYEKGDRLALVLGFVSMLFIEYFFVSTGVEVFKRDSLLGVMPFWLPFLWGYGFVVIKRIVKILKKIS